MLLLERIRTISILLLTIFGCTGNILTLIVVHQRFFRKTASATFISALSISDCIVLLLHSLQIVTKLHPQITSYDCIILFLIDVFRLLSIWIVCCINIERCSLVFNPCHMPRLSSRAKSRILVFILTILSLLVFSHYAVHMHIGYVQSNQNQTGTIRSFCSFKGNFNRLVWGCIKSALTYLLTIPLCIICNMIIIQRLHQASNIERALKANNLRSNQLMITNKLDLSSKQRQLTAMLLTSSILFVLTATPSTIHSTYLLITNNLNSVQYAIHIYTNILLHFHHASNFLAFIFSCRRFRMEFFRLFHRCLSFRMNIRSYSRSFLKSEKNMMTNLTKQQTTPAKFQHKVTGSKRNVHLPYYHNGIVDLGINKSKKLHRQSAPPDL